MRPLRARGGIPRAGPLDERRPCRRAPDLPARGRRPRQERTSYELRKATRRTELAAAPLAPAPRAAAQHANVREKTQRDDDEADATRSTEFVLRDRERDRRPGQEQEAQERQKEVVEGAGRVGGEEPQEKDDQAWPEERKQGHHATHRAHGGTGGGVGCDH